MLPNAKGNLVIETRCLLLALACSSILVGNELLKLESCVSDAGAICLHNF